MTRASSSSNAYRAYTSSAVRKVHRKVTERNRPLSRHRTSTGFEGAASAASFCMSATNVSSLTVSPMALMSCEATTWERGVGRTRRDPPGCSVVRRQGAMAMRPGAACIAGAHNTAHHYRWIRDQGTQGSRAVNIRELGFDGGGAISVRRRERQHRHTRREAAHHRQRRGQDKRTPRAQHRDVLWPPNSQIGAHREHFFNKLPPPSRTKIAASS
eukprot:scaffold5340_cov131-Isochrysis_galbana.AAC.3